MSKGKTAPAGRGFPSASEIVANPIPKIANKKGGKVTTILALDLSTSCSGWAIGMDRQLMSYGKFVFKSGAGIIGEKLASFSEYLSILLDVYEPDKVLVEKPLLRRGTTTARHYELLGVVRAAASDTLGLELLDSWLISPRTVKNLLKVKRGRDHDHNKEIMVRRINDLTGLQLKFDAGSKYKTDDDIADAIAVLLAYYRKGTAD